MRLVIVFETSGDQKKLSDELWNIKHNLEFGVDAVINHNKVKKVELFQSDVYVEP